MHQTTVATICTPAMEKVMASWDLGDTREGRAADLLAILKVSELGFCFSRWVRHIISLCTNQQYNSTKYTNIYWYW